MLFDCRGGELTLFHYIRPLVYLVSLPIGKIRIEVRRAIAVHLTTQEPQQRRLHIYSRVSEFPTCACVQAERELFVGVVVVVAFFCVFVVLCVPTICMFVSNSRNGCTVN